MKIPAAIALLMSASTMGGCVHESAAVEPEHVEPDACADDAEAPTAEEETFEEEDPANAPLSIDPCPLCGMG